MWRARRTAFPYACRLDEKRQRLYVSLWAQAAVAVIDLKVGQVIARWPAQEHPCEMALTRSGKRLFVANSSRNTVTVLDTDSGHAAGDHLGGALSAGAARLHAQQPGALAGRADALRRQRRQQHGGGL